MAATAPRAGDGGGRVDTMVRLPTVTPQLAPPPYPLQRETPSTTQHRSRSCSRSRQPALISSDPRPWTSLFKAPVGSPDLSLEFFTPEVQADKKIAVYETADSAELIETWSMAIVGYVVGLKTSYFPLSSFIKTRWGISSFDLHMLENGFFVCKLYSEEDLQRVLEGFWTIRGHPMILRRWSPDVRLELDSLQSIPLWVSFQGLPLHLWSRRFIAKLCSTLGQPLYIDKATAAQTRLAFARACVLVSSDEDLPNEVFYRDLDGNTRKVHVSYSWKPQRCQHCLSFGHANGACQQTPKQITKVYRPRQAPQQQSESSLMAVAPMVAKTIEHSDSQGQHRGQKDKSKTISLPIMSEPSTTEVSLGTSGQEKHKSGTSSLPISLDPSTITQQTQAQTNLASKDILPQQTQATTNIANKDILSQQTHAPTNLSSQATPTSTIQDIVLQQSYRASTNPANQDHMIQGILKFKNLQAVDEVDKYRNKAIKGKDIVREENTKPKDKKKDGTIHPKS